MNGITYFRLVSPYSNDITKNCGLTGQEIDNNFFVLEGRDVKSVTLDGETLKVNLYNGDVIPADMSGLTGSIKESMSDFVKSLSFEFDRDNGVLKITQNGVTQTIGGFVTSYEDNNVIATDETLQGTGKPESPLGVSRAYRTGAYAPVNMIIDKTNGQTLPSGENLHAGDRFLVHDKVGDYGLLYDYEGVKRITCDLFMNSSKWRVPTKEDWDDMLNAIEPNAANRDHANATSNRYLGKYAGGYLKSKTGWIGSDDGNSPAPGTGEPTVDDMIGNTSTQRCCCGKNVPSCSPMYCGEYTSCCCRPDRNPDASGADMYGFNAKPAGYVDDGGLVGYFGERASFWTATLSPSGNSAYIKRLEWDKTNVYQDIISTKYSLSLRLIKDYDGSNFYGHEQILGETYETVLMPSVKSGSKVWTAVNVAFNNDSYCGIEPNNGLNLTYTERYYIAEWDGHKWVTAPFNEGDSVVVLVAPDGSRAVDYRLVDGSLVRVSDIIAEQVIGKVDEELDEIRQSIADEASAREAADNELRNAIDAEIEARGQADRELNEKIDTEISALDSKIAQEKQDREEMDTLHDEQISDLASKLDQEKQERENADNALAGEIDGIEKRLLASGEFDVDSGVLTLKSEDGESTVINVGFGFNFGDV